MLRDGGSCTLATSRELIESYSEEIDICQIQMNKYQVKKTSDNISISYRY